MSPVILPALEIKSRLPPVIHVVLLILSSPFMLNVLPYSPWTNASFIYYTLLFNFLCFLRKNGSIPRARAHSRPDSDQTSTLPSSTCPLLQPKQKLSASSLLSSHVFYLRLKPYLPTSSLFLNSRYFLTVSLFTTQQKSKAGASNGNSFGALLWSQLVSRLRCAHKVVGFSVAFGEGEGCSGVSTTGSFKLGREILSGTNPR